MTAPTHRDNSLGAFGESATDPDAKKMWVAASKLGYLGIFFGVAICIGFFAGSWLDKRFHTNPWLSIVGMLFGIASGFRELIRVSRQYQREQTEKHERG